MLAIDQLMVMVAKREPFALSRFNDGEMRAIAQPGCVVARGDQVVNTSLSNSLCMALQVVEHNFWRGLPCSACFPEWRLLADKLVGAEPKYGTLAVVQTNRNLQRWKTEFPAAAKGRRVAWVSGSDQNITGLPLDIRRKIDLPTKNCWAVHSEMVDRCDEFDEGSLVMLSCGPMATVLACEWFLSRPDCTFIDIGSTYDPETRGVSHRCHTGKLPPCKECN